MNDSAERHTLLEIPLIEERYGRCVFASIAFHGFLILLIFFGGLLIPSVDLRMGGDGPGGGNGDEIIKVGITGDLPSGDRSMKKRPMFDPPPPAPKPEPVVKKTTAIPLPDMPKPSKSKPTPNKVAETTIAPVTEPIPGVAGKGPTTTGSGGIGIGVGTGSGGPGELSDNYYSQAVVAKISSHWSRPEGDTRVEIIYSFYIAANGTIYGIKKEQSSGNEYLDAFAKRAIDLANPLSPPPGEFKGVKFRAYFVYPPDR
jgi:hypothetical protein